MKTKISHQHLVFKTELRVNKDQLQQFQSHFGATRFAYNCLLNWTLEEYAKHKTDPSYPKPNLTAYSLQKTWVRELRAKYALDNEGNPWWQVNSTHAYRHAAASLAKAYANYFRGTGKHPTWRKHGSNQSYATNGTASRLQANGTVLLTPKIGEVRLHERLRAAEWLQKMGSTLQEVTYSSDATGRIYASLRYRVPNSVALAYFRGKFHRKATGFVGIDLGLKEYATLSDGTVVNNPRYYRKLEAKLAKAQRQLSHKKVAKRKQNDQAKGDNTDWENHSKSHDRSKLRVAIVHRKTRNRRRDFLNKLARELVSQNQTLVIEDLNVEAMKVKFGKSVSDASPAEFRRILTYMASRYGSQVIVADRWFASSKTCSGCGVVKTKLLLNQRTFNCETCGLTVDRDLNAAHNLEAWGRHWLTQGFTDAVRCTESLNGRGPKDLIALDQSRHKAAAAAKASHGSMSQEQPIYERALVSTS